MSIKQELRKLLAVGADVYTQERQIQHQRIMQSEGLKNGIERVVLLRNRVRSRASARKRERVRIGAITSVRHTLERAVKMNAKNIEIVFNVALYLLLIDQDLAYFSNDIVCAIGDRRRAFVAKHEALLLHEAAEDIPQLLGRSFRNAIDALGVPPDQIRTINAVSSQLSKYWQQQRVFLSEIRNALAAHREHDALRYAEELDNLKPLEVMTRAAELSALLELLVDELIKIAQLTSNPTIILQDILDSGATDGAK
jgi:hypothetical protein